MDGNSQLLNNGLAVSIDWLSFTITKLSSLDDVIQILGYSLRDFDSMPHGGKGYRSMLRLNGYPVSVLYDGNDDMGIHVDISGSAISEIIRSFKETIRTDTPFGFGYEIDFNNTFLCELLKKIRTYGHVTRIDLAVDDIGCMYFSTDDVVSLWKEKRIVSKFKRLKNTEESVISGQKTGHTVYLGSRQSDLFLRIYDKKLEQNKRLSGSDKPPIDFPWVRWELECKDARANHIVDLILSDINLGQICIGVLGHYIRIINLNNSNKSRCSMDSLWSDFLDGIGSLKLYMPDREKNINEKKAWINKQVMPTLSAIIVADGGSLEFIENNLETGYRRMKKPLLDMIRKENPAFSY